MTHDNGANVNPRYDKALERLRTDGDSYSETVYGLSQKFCRAPGCSCLMRETEVCVGQARRSLDLLILRAMRILDDAR